jgi:hypothetical protein
LMIEVSRFYPHWSKTMGSSKLYDAGVSVCPCVRVSVCLSGSIYVSK